MYVFILVGQAGIQVGSELWKLIDKEYARTHPTFFNSRNEKARCILVDSEPKVIRNVISNNKELFSENNIIYDQPGRGNNWAFGYFDKRKNALGDTLLERVMVQVERETVLLNSPPLFIIIHSMAGGTGSGLGSRIVASLKDKYKREEEIKIISFVVTPYESGEVVLQFYNCLLCLSELVRKADIIFLLSNEKTMRMLSKHSNNKKSTVSVNEINIYFAKCLAGVLFPTNPGPVDPLKVKMSKLQKFSRPWDHEKNFDVANFINKCSGKYTKLFEIQHSPCFPDSRDVTEKEWIEIAAELSNVIPKHFHKELVSNIGMQLIIRGDKNKLFTKEFTTKDKSNKLPGLIIKSDNIKPDITISLLPTVTSINHNQSITICMNNNTVLDLLNEIYEGASLKFTAKAYVHWYRRYGCTDKIFESAFQIFKDVIKAYSEFESKS